jgi:DNA-binding LytR/AlgR family response regulator
MFFRISALVTLSSVRDLTVVEGGWYLVALDDRRGIRLHASRSGARALRERLGLLAAHRIW